MPLELSKQVTSRELSERLKKLNVPQDSHFSWGRMWRKDISPERQEYKLFSNESTEEGEEAKEYWAAFTASELGEMLPYSVSFYTTLDVTAKYVLWHRDKMTSGTTEAEARGLMLEYLINQGIIKL